MNTKTHKMMHAFAGLGLAALVGAAGLAGAEEPKASSLEGRVRDLECGWLRRRDAWPNTTGTTRLTLHTPAAVKSTSRWANRRRHPCLQIARRLSSPDRSPAVGWGAWVAG